MSYYDIFTNKELIKQMSTLQSVTDPVNMPVMKGMAGSLAIQQVYQSMHVEKAYLNTSFRQLNGVLSNYNLMNYYPDDLSDEEAAENEEVNSRIVTEIFKPAEENEANIRQKEMAVITLSSVNDTVLKYVFEHPQALHQLTSRKFEEVMAEIYHRLGYKIELTKAVKDGGKDIILRKPDILGDFIYYVECKKYASDNPVGVGVVREFSSVVNWNKVNAGIIATTSYFTKDVRDMILDHHLGFQIQMHDYDKIKELLHKVVE